MLFPFAEYKPDISDFRAASTRTLANVLPRADGYGPFSDLTALTSALAAACRGLFFARKSDGTVVIFAATATKLYKLNNTDYSWGDVSKAAGTYSSVLSQDQWQFAQFNNFVFAVQANTVPQVFDLGSSTEFADLGGSPPQARYVSVVNRFLVLSGLLSNPFRIHWSGYNATTTWTSGTSQSDFQDLPDGGIVRGVGGGETGVILQDGAIRRMTYAPGSPVIFAIERVTHDIGVFMPLSLVKSGGRTLFLASQGFYMMGESGAPIPIGRERVDRTVLADLDTASPQLMIGAADPKSSRVFWCYKSNAVGAAAGQFNKIIGYDIALDRHIPPVSISGEYLSSIAQPGVTLEGLDAVAPGVQNISNAVDNGSGLIRLTVGSTSGWTTNDIKAISGVGGTTEANGNWKITVIDGTHIDLQGSAFVNAYTSGGIVGGSLDAMTQSLDSFASAQVPELAAVSTSHVVSLFRGANLEATLVTAEQGAEDQSRFFVRALRPISDTPSAFGSVSKRETQQAAAVFSTESSVNRIGECPQRVSTRYARAKLRVPAGVVWSYATGVEADIAAEGQQ